MAHKKRRVLSFKSKDLLVLSQSGRVAFNGYDWGISPNEPIDNHIYHDNTTMAVDWFFTLLAVLRLDKDAALTQGSFLTFVPYLQWETTEIKLGINGIVIDMVGFAR